eukprot:CAMPEP_0172571990 /NCGR_PEP_ID=MMETSP1067-20121228/133372_1 /TAXON_ID=265564 ORGANISM="Thalassiosira punctigera, Strain Tpunct2005C2" /NCGR_SAMPLE_ID=MMETSP1067 /ASSEMBLY_ACC=CAM_ASM_000444 /LENGTH=56 /DNA_ID=CAMNT_0013364439 /DNA_START=13 /DNA_END=179 /DNA_ORIENTATION=-
MSKKILENADESLLRLKTNGGKDALAFALETFVFEKAPARPTLELLELLTEKGARV